MNVEFKLLQDVPLTVHGLGQDAPLGDKLEITVEGQKFSREFGFSISEAFIGDVERMRLGALGESLERIGSEIARQARFGVPSVVVSGGRQIVRF